MGRKMPLVVLLLDDITDKLRYAQAVWLSCVTHSNKAANLWSYNIYNYKSINWSIFDSR